MMLLFDLGRGLNAENQSAKIVVLLYSAGRAFLAFFHCNGFMSRVGVVVVVI